MKEGKMKGGNGAVKPRTKTMRPIKSPPPGSPNNNIGDHLSTKR